MESNSQSYFCADYLPGKRLLAPCVYVCSPKGGEGADDNLVGLLSVSLWSNAQYVHMIPMELTFWPPDVDRWHVAIDRKSWTPGRNDVVRSCYRPLAEVPRHPATQVLPPRYTEPAMDAILAPGQGLIIAGLQADTYLHFALTFTLPSPPERSAQAQRSCGCYV